jgi:hypothetical protein
MPAVFLLGSDGRHDPRWFPGLENADDLIRFGRNEVLLDEVITPAFGRIQNRRSPFL